MSHKMSFAYITAHYTDVEYSEGFRNNFECHRYLNIFNVTHIYIYEKYINLVILPS